MPVDPPSTFTPPDRDVICPRCNYNLRGITVPRCPECALAIDVDDLATGVLRENLPTWMDTCDPWQPHQVLLAGFWQLVHGAVRPGRVLRTVDVKGSLRRAGLSFLVATFWLYVVSSLVGGLALAIHVGASAQLALRFGLLFWGPWSTLAATGVGALGIILLSTGFVSVAPRLTPRCALRRLMLAGPGMGLWSCLVYSTFALALGKAELWAAAADSAVLLPALMCSVYLVWVSVQELTWAPGRTAATRDILVLVRVLVVVCVLIVLWIMGPVHRQLTPNTLSPPAWLLPME